MTILNVECSSVKNVCSSTDAIASKNVIWIIKAIRIVRHCKFKFETWEGELCKQLEKKRKWMINDFVATNLCQDEFHPAQPFVILLFGWYSQLIWMSQYSGLKKDKYASKPKIRESLLYLCVPGFYVTQRSGAN